jgi:transposase
LLDRPEHCSSLFEKAAATGVSWPLPADWDDRRLEEVLSGRPRPTGSWRKDPAPDFGAVHQQLQTHRNLTLQLVWEEYRQEAPEGYSYSRFSELYRAWVRKLDVVLRQEHRAGEKMFVDFAADKIPVYDQHSGVVAEWTGAEWRSLGRPGWMIPEPTRPRQVPKSGMV